MIDHEQRKKQLIEKAKQQIGNVADFAITDKELEEHILEIAKIIKINEKCEANNDRSTCGADGYHFILRKDKQGKIVIENYLCKKISNNPEFLIKNNYLYQSNEVINKMQRLNQDEIYCTGDKYQNRTKLLNCLLNIKRDEEEVNGVYVYGELGCGKSYILLAFCNELAMKNKSIIYITMNNFSLAIQKSIKDNTDFRHDIVDQLLYADVVVFDELGNETYKDYIHNQIIYPILNYRLNNNRLTVFSSKYDINGLKRVYKLGSKDSNVDQFIDRIKRLCNQKNVFNISPNSSN